MKRQNETAQMIGQIIQPAAERVVQSRPGYRITELVQQEIGTRTFLATDLNSQAQVVVKLLLFCPDLEAEALNQQTGLPPFESSVNLPYLESFEAETPLGAGLVLVKPCTDISRTHVNGNDINHRSAARRVADRQATSSATAADQHSHSLSNNISRPIKNRTLRPTHEPQFVYGSFRIRPTPQKLEIQFPQARILSGLTSYQPPKQLSKQPGNHTLTETIELWLWIVLLTVIFVGGVVIVLQSILAGVIVAALLPLLFQKPLSQRWIGPIIGPNKGTHRMAILRLTSQSEGRTFLSLTTLPPPVRHRAAQEPLSQNGPTKNRLGQVISHSAESTLHCSRRSIKQVKVSPKLVFSLKHSPLMAQLSFSFHNQEARDQPIRIVGSYQEIRWLSQHLAQWGHRSYPQ